MAILLGGGLLLASLLLVVAPRLSTGAPVDGPIRLGAPMPNLSLTDLSGEAVRLRSFAGSVVLVNGWATWCPPCRAEMPTLHDFYLAHQADGFVVLAVNSGEGRATVSDFISQTGFTFPVLLDPDDSLLAALRLDSLPTSILVGRDGVVKNIHIGMYTPEALEADVLPLLR